MDFEWDDNKAASNLQKHGVSFKEASTVFDDPLFIMFFDDEHSIDENRFITTGESNLARLSMVAHPDRDQTTRIISARKTTAHERNFYNTGR